MAIKQDVQTKDNLLRKFDELDDVEGNMLYELTTAIDKLTPLKKEMQDIKDETAKSILLIDGEMLDNTYAGELQLRKTMGNLGIPYVN